MDLFPRTDILGGLVPYDGEVQNYAKGINLTGSFHVETVVLISRE
jgi:hypothetical protein